MKTGPNRKEIILTMTMLLLAISILYVLITMMSTIGNQPLPVNTIRWRTG